MKLWQAVDRCHVRAAVMRRSKPDKKYWKNHQEPISSRVPLEDVDAADWMEYDPRDYDDGSLASFND